MKLSKALVLALVLMELSSVSGWAYSDRIDATPQEIFDAAKVAFAKEGIYKESSEKLSLTTKWIYTKIRRSRKRRFVPLNLEENVNLRYQIKVDIESGKNYSDVSVVGNFQEKQTDAPPQQSWKKSYSSKELYFKEREAFVKILTALEVQKKAVTHPVSPQ